MFSGIVSHVGKVVALDASPQDRITQDWRITIETDMHPSRCTLGASLACNGVCLTVARQQKTQKDRVRFEVQAGTTTRERTTLSDWRVGQSVNLEAALRLGDSLDGHMVTGHVDACVRLLKRIERENEIGLDFLFPAPEKAEAEGGGEYDDLRACCAVRGSVALDGVSLTLAACNDEGFSVAVIPYTAKHTTLGSLKEGERVNCEIDVLARYVARRLKVERGGIR